MSKVRHAIALVATAALSLWSVTVLSAPVPPSLVPMVAALQGRTEVPLLLPADIPFDMFRAIPESAEEATAAGARLGPDGSFAEYFPVVVEATPERYAVVLSVIPESAGAANFGSLAGKKLGPGAGEPQQYAELVRDFQREYPSVRSPEQPARVALDGGVRGWFLPYTCGANCGESEVIFDYNGHRYTVGIEQASRQVVVDLANSALESLQN